MSSSNGAPSAVRSSIRMTYVAVISTAVLSILMWMSSIGLVGDPRILFVPRSRFDFGHDVTNETVNQLGPAKYDVDYRQLNNPNDAISQTMDRLNHRVNIRLAAATFYQRQLNETVYKIAESKRSYVATEMPPGGLGNWMFMVASTFGAARANGRVPMLLKEYATWPEKYFENFTLEKHNKSVSFVNARHISNSGAGTFTPEILNISILENTQNVLLGGFLQSWKYFDFFRDEIRSLFTFTKSTFTAATFSIQKLLQNFAKTNTTFTSSARIDVSMLPTLIGIHVRRGDVAHNEGQMRHGHRPATEEYLLRAALYFQRSYFPVLFIVISNDIPYCKNLYVEPNFLFLENNNEAVDVAALSLMDHIILSVGTYGWWGAYLSDAGEVYYFENWPRNGSDMEKLYNKDDYFLPSWTAFE